MDNNFTKGDYAFISIRSEGRALFRVVQETEDGVWFSLVNSLENRVFENRDDEPMFLPFWLVEKGDIFFVHNLGKDIDVGFIEKIYE